jgi:hypothetical protein
MSSFVSNAKSNMLNGGILGGGLGLILGGALLIYNKKDSDKDTKSDSDEGTKSYPIKYISNYIFWTSLSAAFVGAAGGLLLTGLLSSGVEHKVEGDLQKKVKDFVSSGAKEVMVGAVEGLKEGCNDAINYVYNEAAETASYSGKTLYEVGNIVVDAASYSGKTLYEAGGSVISLLVGYIPDFYNYIEG